MIGDALWREYVFAQASRPLINLCVDIFSYLGCGL